MGEVCPTSVPASMIRAMTGQNVGDVIKSLYEHGVREKPIDCYGNPATPDYHHVRNSVQPDSRHATDEESVRLEIIVRCKLAADFNRTQQNLKWDGYNGK